MLYGYEERIQKLRAKLESKQTHINFVTLQENGTFKNDYTGEIYNSLERLQGITIVNDIPRPQERNDVVENIRREDA